MHTSTPSFRADAQTAQRIKEVNPHTRIGLVGAHVAVAPEQSLKAPGVDFVARNEFDFAIKEVAEGNPWSTIKGLSGAATRRIVTTRSRAPAEHG